MIQWEKVEHGWVSSQFTIIEGYPGSWVATDWLDRAISPRFPSEEEAKAWCEMRAPAAQEPPSPDGL